MNTVTKRKHYLLSFIGTGNYEHTIYSYDRMEYKTALFYEAAAHFLCPDHIVLAMTKEARAKYEDQLNQDLSYEVIEIPTGGTEVEIWEAFNAIASQIPAAVRLSIDITHGFRFQPMMGIAHAAYLQALQDVEIDTILYGAFKGHGHDNTYTDVINLTSFVTLMEWSYGIRSMKRFGQFAPLSSILKETHKAAYKKKASHSPKYLNTLGGQLEALGQALETNHLTGVADAASNVLSTLDSAAADAEALPAATPLVALLDQIKDRAGQLVADQDIRPAFDKLITHLSASGQYQQVITVCREAIVYRCCQWAGLNPDDKDDNRSVEQAIGSLNPQTEDQADLKSLASLYHTVTKARNQVNHAFITKDKKISVHKAVKGIKAIGEEIITWLSESDHEHLIHAWKPYVAAHRDRQPAP